MRIALAVLAFVSLAAVAYAVTGRRAATRAARELRRRSTDDPLTGLPNRTRLEPMVSEVLTSAARRGGRIAVFEVQLHRFDSVNATYGHEVGDALIIAVADQLARITRPGETLLRSDGPRFVVVSPDTSDLPTAEARARALKAAVEVPYQLGLDHLVVNVSVAVALSDGAAGTAADLLADMRQAALEVDSRGSGGVVAFDPTSLPPSAQAARGRRRPANAEHRIRRALENGEFEVRYMPVVDLHESTVVGAEALLRWVDPDRGELEPDGFLPALEESGHINAVGTLVLQEACGTARDLAKLHPDRRLTITVNVSPRQLAQVDVGEEVLAVLAETGADADRVCLEITEGALMHDVQASWASLRRAKDAGVKLALDDFGVGYSSLNYLRRFDLDVLKIDRSFVAGVDRTREDYAIVEQLVGLAHALEIVPVAEGVERPEQAEALKGVRCDFAQGFIFGPPLRRSEFDTLVEQRRVMPRTR